MGKFQLPNFSTESQTGKYKLWLQRLGSLYSVWQTELNSCTVHGWTNAVAQLVQALRYKPDSRKSDSRLCHWNGNFHWPVCGLKGLSTGGIKVAGAWNLGPSTSWNSQGLFRPVWGLLYLCSTFHGWQ